MTVIVVIRYGHGDRQDVVTTAAVAAARSRGAAAVAVLKPAQTGVAPGEPGDAAEVARLAGADVTAVELARFPEPLAPDDGGTPGGPRPGAPARDRRGGRRSWPTEHDLVLVEGAGGLLVRFDEEGGHARGRRAAAGGARCWWWPRRAWARSTPRR